VRHAFEVMQLKAGRGLLRARKGRKQANRD
jgi:hypothetical protein